MGAPNLPFHPLPVKVSRGDTPPCAGRLTGAEVAIDAGHDLVIQASDIKSEGKLDLAAGHQIQLLTATNVDESHEKTKYKNNTLGTETFTDAQTGKNGLRNLSGLGTRNTLVSPGRIVRNLQTHEDQAGRSAARPTLGGTDITMRSGADTTLQAAVIQADTLGIKVGQDKDGNVIDDTARLNLIGVKESTLDQTGHDRHSFVWDNIADQGVYQESLVMPEIHLTGKNEDGSPTQPDIQTPGGYTVGALALAPTQYEIRQAQEEAEARAKAEAKQQEMLAQLSGQPLTLTPKLGKTGTDDKAAPAQEATPTETPARQKAKTLIPEQVWQCTGIIEKQCGWVTPPDLTLRTKATELAKQPGLEWLADLAKRDDVDWQKVELATKDWDYHHAGLTPEGAAIVVIVVTILTWGSASSAAAGAAEGAGMTTAAGTTGASTVMVGEGVALTTTGAAVSAGVTAGLTTLASQAAVSLINHQGDIGETLKDLGSKESVKQVVAAMLSAGLAQGATTALNLPNPATNTAFVDRFRTYATQATVKAGVQSLVFGTPLEETAKAALVSSLAQSLTAEVGDWGVENKLPPGSLEKMLAHAVVQCAAASALGQDCGAGALGGAIAEALAPIGDQLDQSGYAKDNKLGGQLGNAIASMSAMLVASLAGQNGMTASAAASMVDSFNRQLHPTERTLAKKLAEKSNGQFTEAEIADALRWASNNELGETAGSNTVVNAAQDNALDNSPTDAIASTAFDPMIPGQTTTADQPYAAGQGTNGTTLVQNMNQVAQPSVDLMAYIQMGTGDTYSWDTSAWQAPPSTLSSDNTRYALFTANGQTFQLPIADCPAAGCQGSPIAWASTNPEDQAALRAYATASGVEMTSFVSRTSGIIGSAATTAAATPGPHQPVAFGTSVVATSIGLAADAVEAALQDDPRGYIASQLAIGVPADQLAKKYPLFTPLINEVAEKIKGEVKWQR